MKHLFAGFLVLAFAGIIKGQEIDSIHKMKLSGHSGDLECVAYSPTGKLMATSGWDKVINVYKADTPDFGLKLLVLPGHLAAVSSLNFSRNGKYLVSAGKDYSVRIWNMDTPTITKVFNTLHTEVVTNAFVDGISLFSCSSDGTIKNTNMNDAKKSRVIKIGVAINDMAISGDRKFIYVAVNGTGIRKVEITGKEAGELVGHTDYVNALDMSLNGKLMASASSDKTAIIWDMVTGKPLQILKGHEWKVTSVKFSADGKYLVTGGNEGSVMLWEVETGKLLKSFKGPGSNTRDVAFSTDASQIAVATYLKNDNFGSFVYNSGVVITKPVVPAKAIPAKGTPSKVTPAKGGNTNPANGQATQTKGGTTTPAIIKAKN
ncbi:MAG: WD40 repeat domain-containing protein [Bacteroidia bacterium]|nr:WD40 repeat domain-containing protein [Bacteroidia bacterium]